jgi:hypothetical protein
LTLLAHISAAAFRVESKLLKRFPEREITRLFLAGHIELGPGERSWRVTAAGRAELSRLRLATALVRGAA